MLDHTYHFSISHSDKIAAAIISKTQPVGIDAEMITDKALRVAHKFLSEEERAFIAKDGKEQATLLWSIKETIFKWYGLGNVDFKNDIQIHSLIEGEKENSAVCFFKHSNPQILHVKYLKMNEMIVSWK